MSEQTKALARIEGLADEGSFVEIGAYVTARETDFSLSEKKEAGDGVVTGYATIEGKLVFVYSQDAAVLGGSLGEMHAKKIIRLYEMAMKMGAPIIGLIDCAGVRLEESTDGLYAFGELFKVQAKASGIVPEIQIVFGKCGRPLRADGRMIRRLCQHLDRFASAPRAALSAAGEGARRSV